MCEQDVSQHTFLFDTCPVEWIETPHLATIEAKQRYFYQTIPHVKLNTPQEIVEIRKAADGE